LRRLSLFRRIDRLWLAAFAAGISWSGAHAQTSTPTAQFQYSAITGSNSVINATRVPVTDSSGKVSYWDVTINFTVSADGVPSTASGSLQPSKALKVSSFQPGTYKLSTDPNFAVVLSGPGIGVAGTTVWSISSAGDLCGAPSSSEWWTGPIVDNPLATRITTAKISSKDYSYGSVGTNGNCWPFYNQRDLIGASQVAGTLTISDFTDIGGNDHSVPQAQVTLVLQP